MGAGWVAMPFLCTAGLAMVVRHNMTALAVMFVALLVAGFAGVSILNSSSEGYARSRQEVQEAVQPGEDPNRGPAAMRRTGAEVGEMVSSAFAIAVVVVVPPVQLAAVAVATLVAYGLSRLLRTKRHSRVSGRPDVE